MTSPLTNTRTGNFHKIELLNASGVFQDLLSLVTSGAGITTLTAAGRGIAIAGTGATRTLTVDLSALATIASMNTALANKIESLVAGTGVTISGSGVSRTISASGGAATILQLGGAAQSGATTINVASNIGAFANNTLSITAQPAIGATTDIAMQDLTCRFITGGNSSSAFTVKGHTLITLQDAAGNNLADFQHTVTTLPRPLTCENTATFRQAITIANVGASLSGQFYLNSNNRLTWQNQELVDLPSLLGLLVNKITTTSNGGLARLANATTGEVQLSLDQSFRYSQISFQNSSTKSLRCIIQNGSADLVWGVLSGTLETIATQPWANQQLALKQSLLTGLNQTAQNTISANTNLDNHSLSIRSHIVSRAQAQINLEYASGSNHILWANNASYAMYTPNPATEISWYNSAGVALKASANSLNCVCGGSIAQNSDRRCKDRIEDADTESCQHLLKNVSARTYQRTDFQTDKTRLGFVSQELLDALPAGGEFQNLVVPYSHEEADGSKAEYYGIDYARISCVLWTVVRSLTARIEALEGKRAPKKSTKVKPDAL